MSTTSSVDIQLQKFWSTNNYQKKKKKKVKMVTNFLYLIQLYLKKKKENMVTL